MKRDIFHYNLYCHFLTEHLTEGNIILVSYRQVIDRARKARVQKPYSLQTDGVSGSENLPARTAPIFSNK